MRLKPVPPAPDSLDAVFAVQSAVPLVPGSEDDCCARIVARTFVDEREDASDWLTFLRALGLARETSQGFVRETGEPSREELAGRFRANVYGAQEVLDALVAPGGRPRGAEDVFAGFDAVPRWERSRNPDWEAVWRERVDRLLDWAVVFGLAEREESGYLVASSGGDGDE